MRTRTQLELLRKLHQSKGLARGFTLVELMVVVAIVGLLSAVAIPQFNGARNAAQAGAKIGEIVGLAKECGTYLASNGLTTNPDSNRCTLGTGGTYSASWAATVPGLNCLGTTSAGAIRATISITAAGGMSCALSAT